MIRNSVHLGAMRYKDIVDIDWPQVGVGSEPLRHVSYNVNYPKKVYTEVAILTTLTMLESRQRGVVSAQ